MTDFNYEQNKQGYHGKQFKRNPYFNSKNVHEGKKGKYRNKGNTQGTHSKKQYKMGMNNVCEQQPDSELFFFDISGNKRNLETLSPHISNKKLNDKRRQMNSKKFLSKYKWRKDTHGTEALKNNNGISNSQSPLLRTDNVTPNLQSPELKTPKKKNKKKKHKKNQLNVSMPTIKEHLFREVGGGLKESNSKNDLSDKKENGGIDKKRFSTNIPPIRKKELEMCFKNQYHLNLPLLDKPNVKTLKDKNQTNISPSNGKETKTNFKDKEANSVPSDKLDTNKKENGEIVIDIRDSDYEMTCYNVSGDEKKKKKNKVKKNSGIQEHAEDVPNTNKEIHTDEGNQFKNKKAPNESVSFSNKKRKKDQSIKGINTEKEQSVNEVNTKMNGNGTLEKAETPVIVVDIAESDCEAPTKVIENEELKVPKKKKKKKNKTKDISSGLECNSEVVGANEETSAIPVDNSNLRNNNVQENDNHLSKEDENQLISDILGEIRNDISYYKKKKKKKKKSKEKKGDISVDNTIESNHSNTTGSPLISIDIRDSECEMTVIDDNPPRKKKKHKHRDENRKSGEDKNFDSIMVNGDVDIDVTSRKKTKKKHVENDTNAVNGNELNLNESVDSKVKKKKRKIDSRSEIETDTPSRKKKKKERFRYNLTDSDTESIPKNESEDEVSSGMVKMFGDDIKIEEHALLNCENIEKKSSKNSKRKYTNGIIKKEADSLNGLDENVEELNNVDNQNLENDLFTPNGKEDKKLINGEKDNSESSPKIHKRSKSRISDVCNITTNDIANSEEDVDSECNNVIDYKDPEDGDKVEVKHNHLDDSSVDDEEEYEKHHMDLKWEYLKVNASFNTPTLHALLTRTSGPTKEQTEEIKRLNLEVKTGMFTKKEDELIMTNWQKFCEVHNFPMKPKFYLKFPRRLSHSKKMDFLRYIAQGLDNRLLHRVHARFKTLMSRETVKLGRFTSEEDRQILEYMDQSLNGRPFSQLSKIMGRSRDSLFKRYRRLIATQNWTVHWTPELISSFLGHFQRITKVADVNELEYRKITLKEWKKLSKKMSPIPVTKLQMAWQNTIYPRLFVCEGVDLREIKARIIKRLMKRNETDWKAVDWEKITRKFPGFSSHKIYMMFKQLVIFHVPKEKQGDLKECLNFLNDKLLIYNSIPTTHRLKKIKIKDKDVEVR